MKTNRRKFIETSFAGAIGASLPGCASRELENINDKYSLADEILKHPVLKQHLFPDPVIIDTLELLRLNNNFLCRVRSKDGAEGISVANDAQMISLWPIFTNRLQPYFPGKDARNLEKLLEEVYVYQSNYKMQSLALWVPLATIEFAILDMLGKIAGKSIGELIHECTDPLNVNLYQPG